MRKVLVLDSSQIDTFDTCPEKWKLQYNEDLTLSNEVREDMAMGTYGHKLLEIYYTEIALGKPVNVAVEAAQNFHLSGEFPLSQGMKDKVLKRFNEYWMIYCARDIIPSLGSPTKEIQFGGHTSVTHENPGGCTKCSRKYSYDSEEGDSNYEVESCPNNPITVEVPKPLVEQGFSYELLNNDEYLFVLEGKIDLIGTLSGQLCFLDHKWQGRKRSLYQKSIQFRNYALATNLSLGVINYIRLADKFESDTLQRQIISFPPWERRRWKAELIEIYKEIANEMDKPMLTKRRSQCSGKFGYACEYTRICEEENLVTIEAIKNANYKKREKWSPW